MQALSSSRTSTGGSETSQPVNDARVAVTMDAREHLVIAVKQGTYWRIKCLTCGWKTVTTHRAHANKLRLAHERAHLPQDG